VVLWFEVFQYNRLVTLSVGETEWEHPKLTDVGFMPVVVSMWWWSNGNRVLDYYEGLN
jgi:hypothetical protein